MLVKLLKWNQQGLPKISSHARSSGLKGGNSTRIHNIPGTKLQYILWGLKLISLYFLSILCSVCQRGKLIKLLVGKMLSCWASFKPSSDLLPRKGRKEKCTKGKNSIFNFLMFFILSHMLSKPYSSTSISLVEKEKTQHKQQRRCGTGKG
jgi:hypothetical protein